MGIPAAAGSVGPIQTGSAAAPARQIPALDGIRGLAIIWVVLHNTVDRPFASVGGAFHLLAMFTHIGWIGVQLFFALSGFLITAGLLDSQGASNYFRNFYAKRALRILPLYYTVLLALLVVLPALIALPAPFSNRQQASLWLFAVNWTQAVPYGFGHFWSLAVEEQFYLLWPLLVWRLPPHRLLKVCVWIALAALLLRSALAVYGVDSWILYQNTACRMDALALGGAGACLLRVPALREHMVGRLRALGTVALLLFLAGIPLTHLYDRDRWTGETFGYTLLAFCSAAFVSVAALPPEGRTRSAITALLAWAPLCSCGRYSYAMYVFHGLLHKLLGEPWLDKRFGAQPSVKIALMYSVVILLITYLLAFCSYHALEKHFLRLKRVFASSTSAG
jgi:peptidoglycan/LPS O-acetylase OafA/YrhL